MPILKYAMGEELMKRIFIGLVFILLNLNIDIGSIRIGFIPDFLGYIMIYKGLGELEDKSENFINAKRFCIPLAIYSGIIYVINILGINFAEDSFDDNGYIIFIIFELTASIMSLYILYGIIKGINDLENCYIYNFNYEKLMLIWKFVAAATAATYVFIFIPSLVGFGILANLVLTIVLLYQFNITRIRYYNYLAGQQEVNQ